MFLEEALQGGTTAILLAGGNHDITVFTGGLGLNYDIVTVTNMIFDHRTALYNECVGTLLFQFPAYIKPLTLLGQNVNRLACGDTAHDGNTSGLLGKLNATTLL